jgi:ribonuclease R
MKMDGADVVSASFYRSLIRSDQRLTYEQVDRIFAGEEHSADPWGSGLEAARRVAAALRERRQSLAVTSSEPVFEFDSKGNVTGIRHEEQTESHSVIEQLMILANEQVAGLLADKKVPALYRVHERPSPQAVRHLADQLASLDVPAPALPKEMTPQQASDAATEISRMVADYVQKTGRGARALTSLVLRSQKQAHYSPRNLGHAGLNSTRYCHFTSPIRRYPDLVVHRARELSGNAWDRVFEGEIVGLIGKGAFVAFGDEAYEGFLPARRLHSDWFEMNEQETMLVGERSGTTLRLGDPVSVKVDRVDAPRGRVDLKPGSAE